MITDGSYAPEIRKITIRQFQSSLPKLILFLLQPIFYYISLFRSEQITHSE